MFFKKHFFVVYISKRFIDPGFVTLGSTLSFDGGEAFEYTKETLADVLKEVGKLSKQKMRIVLGEELVYVTELSFPGGTDITRELVLEKAEQSIPEDLRKTNWDFQTLRYTKKAKDEREVLVQVAVVEKSFSDNFLQALRTATLAIESIVPESYMLASLERGVDGVSIIIEKDREISVMCAVENGFAIATRVEENEVTPQGIREFLNFLSSHKQKKATRLIFSHFSESEMGSFQELAQEGQTIETKNYNPLVGAALQKKIVGKDEEILNIDIFSSLKKEPRWKIFR